MRRVLVTTLAVIAAGVGTASGLDRPPVAVYVTGDQVPSAQLGEFSDRLVYELTRTGAFDVRRRFTSRQSRMFRELTAAGCTTASCLGQAGRILEVQGMVAGNVALRREPPAATIYTVSIRLVNVERESEERAVTEECRCWWGQVLTGTAPRLAAQLAGVEPQPEPAKQDTGRPPTPVQPPAVARSAPVRPDTVRPAATVRAQPDRQALTVPPKPAQPPPRAVPRPQPTPSAQPGDFQQGHADGERDARAAANRPLWFAAGCVGGAVGLLIAYVIEPSPPATKLLGKSAEYAVGYTDAYKRAGKSLQARWALYGCGTCACAYLAYWIAVISAMES